MAKKKVLEDNITELNGGIDSIFKMVLSIDKEAEIISTSAYSNILDWISTGNYILNACMSGDIYKAISSGRFSVFQGDSGTAKSFLSCSCCREALKKGYIPIYLDSEGAIDSDFVKRLGVDPTKLIVKKVNTILETSQFIANLCDELQKQQDKTGTHDKILIVLDSLGNLTSDKEREDTLAGSNKVDFSKAKDVKAMFRVLATPIAKLQIPMIIVNHVYKSMSFIPSNISAMGCVLPTEEIYTLEHGLIPIKDIVEGDHVFSHDMEFHEVLKTYKLKKPTYTIELSHGELFTCSDTHRFLINIDEPDNEDSWKTITELNENDEIYMISEI